MERRCAQVAEVLRNLLTLDRLTKRLVQASHDIGWHIGRPHDAAIEREFGFRNAGFPDSRHLGEDVDAGWRTDGQGAQFSGPYLRYGGGHAAEGVFNIAGDNG